MSENAIDSENISTPGVGSGEAKGQAQARQGGQARKEGEPRQEAANKPKADHTRHELDLSVI
jgi:hypothetical protein